VHITIPKFIIYLFLQINESSFLLPYASEVILFIWSRFEILHSAWLSHVDVPILNLETQCGGQKFQLVQIICIRLFQEPGWCSRSSNLLWPRGRSSSPGRMKNFLFSTSSRPVLGSTQPPIQWVSGAFTGVKRQGREADHSPPNSAKVKKMRIYTSTPPYAFMA
jgi:hypothetical protein